MWSEFLDLLSHTLRAFQKWLLETKPGVSWWQFWWPGSGIRGGLILAVLFYAIYYFFSR